MKVVVQPHQSRAAPVGGMDLSVSNLDSIPLGPYFANTYCNFLQRLPLHCQLNPPLQTCSGEKRFIIVACGASASEIAAHHLRDLHLGVFQFSPIYWRDALNFFYILQTKNPYDIYLLIKMSRHEHL